MTVDLGEQINFFSWAHEEWPAPRWSVKLDPYQPTPAT
jgi:hypothetical protein